MDPPLLRAWRFHCHQHLQRLHGVLRVLYLLTRFQGKDHLEIPGRNDQNAGQTGCCQRHSDFHHAAELPDGRVDAEEALHAGTNRLLFAGHADRGTAMACPIRHRDDHPQPERQHQRRPVCSQDRCQYLPDIADHRADRMRCLVLPGPLGSSAGFREGVYRQCADEPDRPPRHLPDDGIPHSQQPADRDGQTSGSHFHLPARPDDQLYR